MKSLEFITRYRLVTSVDRPDDLSRRREKKATGTVGRRLKRLRAVLIPMMKNVIDTSQT